MSLYLFKIYLDPLSKLIHGACENKLWATFRVGRRKVPISYLMFVNELVIFERLDESMALTICNILENLCAMSGQKFNKAKNKLSFSHNNSSEIRTLLQETLNVHESAFLRLYLRVPIYHRKPSHTQVHFNINKVRDRLEDEKLANSRNRGDYAL